MICTSENSGGEKSSFYKIDADGIVTDSLIIRDEISYHSHYLLNPLFYYDWIITEKRNKHNYVEISNKGITTPATLDVAVKKYYQQATATHLYYDDDLENKPLHKYLFLINKQWHSLTIDKSLDEFTFQNKYEKYQDDRLKYFKLVNNSLILPEWATDINSPIHNIPYSVIYPKNAVFRTAFLGYGNLLCHYILSFPLYLSSNSGFFA